MSANGRMNLIHIGISRYQHWDELKFVPPQHARFADYVREQWPDARISGAADEPWTVSLIREKLAARLGECREEDDLILLWSGHGLSDTRHRPLPASRQLLGLTRFHPTTP
jgi:hypothetical protein